jgi:hypothetical protein
MPSYQFTENKSNANWWTRISYSFVAFIFISAGFYLMKLVSNRKESKLGIYSDDLFVQPIEPKKRKGKKQKRDHF